MGPLTKLVDIAQIATPIVAIGGFAFLWQQIRTANAQTVLTQQQLELSRNSLMPRLSLAVDFRSIVVKTEDGVASETIKGMLLAVENVGPGMASVALATMRDDLSTESAYNPVLYTQGGRIEEATFDQRTRITDFVIGSGQSVQFLLKFGHQYRLGSERETLSSLSLYYMDVYERVFQTRIIYVWRHDSGGWHVEIIGREYCEVETLPMNPYSTTDIRVYSDMEGGRPVWNKPQYHILHFQSTRAKFAGFKMKGLPLTNNLPIKVQSYDFEHLGSPRYTLQVDKHDLFILTPEARDEQITVKLSTPGGVNGIEFDRLGLRATTDLPQQLLELYGYVTSNILQSSKTSIQLEYTNFVPL